MAEPEPSPEPERADLTVRCACGWQAVGTEAQLIEATVEHGRRLHNMQATPDQVRAMIVTP